MRPVSLTILAIDDDPGDIELLRRSLEDLTAFAIDFVACSSMQEGRHALQRHYVDVIILDYLLGGHTGLDFLQELRNNGYQRPIIMLTGKGDERVAAHAMRNGSDDYMVKEDLTPAMVTVTLEHVLARFHNDQKRAQHEAELLRLARFDELTGLYNRRYLLDRLAQETLRARRYDSDLCIMMIDVDHFKRINDSYGHLMGDKVLANLAVILNAAIRVTDIAGRYGGEEFCIILTETNLEGGHKVAKRLRERIAARYFSSPDGGSFHVTCSIGLAQFDSQVSDQHALLARADGALYEAKNAGRDRVVLAAATTL